MERETNLGCVGGAHSSAVWTHIGAARRSGRAHECRRCLKPVEGRFDRDVTMVFVAEGEAGPEDDGDVHVFDPSEPPELSEAVREEVVLVADRYVVCSPECRGLCSGCGVDLNVGECTCEDDDPDPRWEALRALMEK